MKSRLVPRRPANMEEWGELPLWLPHLNHVDGDIVRYSTAAQRALRECGFNRMADVSNHNLQLINWEEAVRRGAPRRSEAAFGGLIRNLKSVPEVDHPDDLHDLFLQDTSSRARPLIWQFRVQARFLSARRIPFLNGQQPVRTFCLFRTQLVPITNCLPTRDNNLERVLVRSPKFSSSYLHMGRWNRDRHLLTQYKWRDGTVIIHSSIAQLRILQTTERPQIHNALHKWARQLACTIPAEIWHVTWTRTWISYRSAAENTFLWQILYRIPTTNKWRFPRENADNPETWCTRCQLQVQEDVYHCIWACPASRGCWSWCSSMISWISASQPRGTQLTPAQVLVGENLPDQWETPVRFWHTLRAVMCWIVWKDRNQHVFNGEIKNSQRMVGQAWSRLGVYVKLAWRDLLMQVRLQKCTLPEAIERMSLMFGDNGKIWTLQDITIQVSPVPPRPP